MKAIVLPRYGSTAVLQFKEIPRPSPSAGEVLVKVHAASVNAGDWHLMRGDPWVIRLMTGLFKPKIRVPGADVAGVVEEVGPGTAQFEPGDEVFGDLSESGYGAFAEYSIAKETSLTLKPKNVTMEEAAVVPAAGLTALQALRKVGQIKKGDQVVIEGASGGVGHFAVQLARGFGAEVTAVCSTAKMDLVKRCGADLVIDYGREDFTESRERYDLIHGANATHPLKHYQRVLKDKGIYVQTGGSFKQFMHAGIKASGMSKKRGQQFQTMLVKPNQPDQETLKQLMKEGKLKPFIDRQFSLEQVPEAIRYLEDRKAKGKVVIKL